MKPYEQHSLEARENVFMFVGFDYWGRELVKLLSDGHTLVLVDGVLHTMTPDGEPECPVHKLTESFNAGFYIGHGCFGNGTVYWNRRVEKNGDYEKFGQVTESGELIIRTDKPTLIDFLKIEAGGKNKWQS